MRSIGLDVGKRLRRGRHQRAWARDRLGRPDQRLSGEPASVRRDARTRRPGRPRGDDEHLGRSSSFSRAMPAGSSCRTRCGPGRSPTPRRRPTRSTRRRWPSSSPPTTCRRSGSRIPRRERSVAGSRVGPPSSPSGPGAATGSAPSSCATSSAVPGATRSAGTDGPGLPRSSCRLTSTSSSTARCRLLDGLEAEISLAEAGIAGTVVDDRRVRRLLSIPGVGLQTATGLVALIGDIGRFHRPNKLVSYLGLDPIVRQSGGRPAYTGHISHAGQGHVRGLLVEAALGAARVPGPLHAFYGRVAGRRGHAIAIVAVARKLAVLAWHLLTTTRTTAGPAGPNGLATQSSATEDAAQRATMSESRQRARR